jgi:hypothetical protein
MTIKLHRAALCASLLSLSVAASPAFAKDDAIAIAKCDASRGSVAVVDGDTQGWTKFNLGSPRELIGAMVAESGCFTMHDPASGKPADFLISAIAGSKEDVDHGVNIAKAAATEGALRSGALGAVPGGAVVGGALRMFGGFGGKKKSVAAGLRVISPATGQTLISGSGEAKKSVLTWGGGTAGGYGGSKDGKMLMTAFAEAYNSVVAQAVALPAKPQ